MEGKKVATQIKLMEGFDLADLKVALAREIEGKEYQLKNVFLEDDSPEETETDVPAHMLTYELIGNLDENQIKNELEAVQNEMGTFVIETVQVENL